MAFLSLLKEKGTWQSNINKSKHKKIVWDFAYYCVAPESINMQLKYSLTHMNPKMSHVIHPFISYIFFMKVIIFK